ncbi:MAG: hypothetical protein KatS3mg103_0096 [Phycisphaerales bacterium]|nr:MAG: hypothetical protein KatS3mg103_0096 [Phycisphaerales bacterium]
MPCPPACWPRTKAPARPRLRSKAKPKVRYSLQRDAQALRAARGQASQPTFHIAGPSRYAIRSSSQSRADGRPAGSRRYTEQELAEIRAAQVRLVRQLVRAGTSVNPGGSAVLSHPTLGKVVVQTPTGAMAPPPGQPSGGILTTPVPGLLTGPSPIAGGFSGDPQSQPGGGDPGSGEPRGGSGSGDFPVLVPGRGFAGPTPQPPAVGNPSLRGYDAQAIARWDVVPYQDFDGLFHIGVVAFHMNGIDRVEFSVNGGPWTAVREMKLNPRTNVWEYTATLDASMFDDGLVEVRAKVYPRNAGEVRVLAGEIDFNNTYRGSQWTGNHSLFLYSNHSGELRRQIIELEPGHYEWGQEPLTGFQEDPDRWLIIRPKPGVAREDVVITKATRIDYPFDFKRVKLESVTLDASHGTILRAFGDKDQIVWLEKCTYTGRGQHEQSQEERVGNAWTTNSSFSNLQVGPFKGFFRNVEFSQIGEDVMRGAYFVANVTVRSNDRGPRSDWHPAVIANPISHDNRIYLNLTAKDQVSGKIWAFRQGTRDHWEHRDVAIVNCDTRRHGSATTYNMMLGGQVHNLYIHNSTLAGGIHFRLSEGLPDHWRFNPSLVVFDHVNWGGEYTPSQLPLDNVYVLPDPIGE